MAMPRKFSVSHKICTFVVVIGFVSVTTSVLGWVMLLINPLLLYHLDHHMTNLLPVKCLDKFELYLKHYERKNARNYRDVVYHQQYLIMLTHPLEDLTIISIYTSQIYFIDFLIGPSMWNCSHFNAPEPHWFVVNIAFKMNMGSMVSLTHWNDIRNILPYWTMLELAHMPSLKINKIYITHCSQVKMVHMIQVINKNIFT